jgi:hypothetical protein
MGRERSGVIAIDPRASSVAVDAVVARVLN